MKNAIPPAVAPCPLAEEPLCFYHARRQTWPLLQPATKHRAHNNLSPHLPMPCAIPRISSPSQHLATCRLSQFPLPTTPPTFHYPSAFFETKTQKSQLLAVGRYIVPDRHTRPAFRCRGKQTDKTYRAFWVGLPG